MNSQKMSLTVVFAALLAVSISSFAQTNNPDSHHQPQPQKGGFTTNAKLALSYSPLVGLIRSVGVKSVTNPDTGVFCITPSVALNLSEIYPLVSIEWGESAGNALMAFWRDTSIDDNDCGEGLLEVQTFDFNAGGYPVVSESVAFDLVIH
jgi:hypothetical protein